MIQTISARLNHPEASQAYKDCYCFDNPETDLIAEPFVHSTTEVIRESLKWATLPPSEFVKLRFTDNEVSGMHSLKQEGYPVVVLNLLKPEEDGNNYKAMCTYPSKAFANWAKASLAYEWKCWLCPVLLQYFTEVPKDIFCQIKPIATFN